MGSKIESSPGLPQVLPVNTEDSHLGLIDGSRVFLKAKIRMVPDRRMVYQGMWNDQPVYAKLFYGKKAWRDVQRDANGIKAFLQAGIATPALLYEGELPAGGYALLFSEIVDGQSAEQLMAESPESGFDLALQLVNVLAAHHTAGLLQTDLYLKNFLRHGKVLYSLDGDGVRSIGKPLGKKRSLDHLAQLLSKFDALALQKWLPALLMQYLAERKWTGDADLEAMKLLIARHRYSSMAKYADRKVFRECTDVHVDQSWHQHFYAAKRRCGTPLAQWQQSPDVVFAPDNSQLLKPGNTCTVIATQFGQERVVIKRYNIKNLMHGLNRALRRSRAALSWANAFRLKAAGVATAEPVALLERRLGPFRREAYFVADYVEAPDALQYFADEGISETEKQLASQAIARMFRKLLALGITHGDCKATNIKMLNGEPLLIDLDSMRQYEKPEQARGGHVRDLQRLLRNWQDNSGIRQMLETALTNEYEDIRLLRAVGIATSKTT